MAKELEVERHFQLIAKCLNRHRVNYVVIGGIAAMLHDIGIEETLDVDVAPQRERKNLRALANALREMEARLRVPDEPEGIEIPLDERTFKDMLTMTFITRFGPFDILFEPEGGRDYDHLRVGATVMERFGIDIMVASVADLVRMKRASGREKDTAHLALLLEFLKQQEDGA